MAETSHADLERMLLRELLGAWHQHNADDFARRMRPPSLTLHDQGPLGRFFPTRREISLQRDFTWTAPWGQVVEVLRHEMAHQYVFEVEKEKHETAHGPVFRRVCRDRGIDARAAGLPDPDAEVDDRIVRKVRGLLALATSDNPNEAEAAANAARRLLARYDMDLGDALERTPYTFRQVGPTKGRFAPWEKALGGLLARHFGVSALYARAYRAADGKWGRVLELLGPTHHVAVAAYVHDVLRETGERLWRAHRKKARLRGDKHRQSYLFGVMVGFRESLDTEVASDETALVHVSQAELRSYVSSRYAHIRGRKWTGVVRSEALEQGKLEGRKISVRPAVEGERGPPKRLVDKGR